MLEKNKRYEVYSALTKLGLFSIALFGAFSKKSREKIKERDGNKSALSGKRGRLHAAHIDHSRNDDYDNPNNGRMLTVLEHYEDHYYRHGRNGLTKKGNIAALRLLWNQLDPVMRDVLPSPDTLE